MRLNLERMSENDMGLTLDYFDLVRESKGLTSPPDDALRIALLADASTQHLVPLIRVLLHQRRMECLIYEAPFDAVELEVYDGQSGLYNFRADAIVLFNSVQALRAAFSRRPGDGSAFVGEVAGKISRVWTAIQSHTTASILQSTFVLPYEKHFGNFDQKVAASFSAVVSTLNSQIISMARENGSVLINDVDFVASWIGRQNWFDDRLWDMAKAPCAIEQLPYLAANIAQIVSALRGRIVKCVAVDLDNTLWGGVIGDDGIDGIKLSAHGDGEAFYRLQLFLAELVKRGILLAVCSKNEMDHALLPFERHPEMVLKRSDIACFVANWNDKAQNIRGIRETLNIGYDSIVFLDDNSFERNLVRALLPDVIVPELPEDPADYVRAICELNLFESASFSVEDLQRTELYRQEATRKQEETAFASFEEYLQSLAMKLTISRFDPYHLPRISQLLQRSNQFNLTTRRRTETECAALMKDPKFIPLYAKLSDRLGDHGLIAVVIAEIMDDELALMDWLMSCRVLKRGVEQALMNEIFQQAAGFGLSRVSGEYRPTAKNGMVKNFFAEFGFQQADDRDGYTKWQLQTAMYKPSPVFIEAIAVAHEAKKEPVA
jgi:FkbH-like protein